MGDKRAGWDLPVLAVAPRTMSPLLHVDTPAFICRDGSSKLTMLTCKNWLFCYFEVTAPLGLRREKPVVLSPGVKCLESEGASQFFDCLVFS